MRFLFTPVFLLALCGPATAQKQSFRFGSPSGKLQAIIFADSAHHLAWSLSLGGKPLVMRSALGISAGSADPGVNVASDLGQDVTIGIPTLSRVSSSFPCMGAHRNAVNIYRQAVIPVMAKHVHYTLECRVFEDGFAFRYIVPPGFSSGKIDDRGSLVTGESSSWHIPDGSRVWYQENIYYYEGLHYMRPVKELGIKHLGPPVTYQTPSGLYGSITEAALYNYSGMSLLSDSTGTLHATFVNDSAGWRITGTITTPWRVILASATLDGLVNSDIIADLNPAPDAAAANIAARPNASRLPASPDSAAATASWIKPGRAVWSYFVHDNVTTLALEKEYVDKAAALGFEYSIVDAGWGSSWPNAYDSLSSLVRYAGARHIGIFVWKSYASLADDSIRKAFFRDMHRIGVAGLKIDYIDKEGIDQVRFYEKALQDGLASHLLIDFHGANKPTGYNRRFPNEITREGIYGQEWRTYTPQGAINNAIIPFTRFLAGPADYTPGVFSSSLAYGTSRAQQLALPVIYSSPLLCWADDPAVYLASPALNIIRDMPTTWDETRVLPFSRIGELVGFARRKGKDWYIAVINAGEEKRLTLPLSCVTGNSFKADIISDDLTSSDRILHSITRLWSRDSLHIVLGAKGGFVAQLKDTDELFADISIQPYGGYLQGPQQVRISTSARVDHFVHYTLDGSEPDDRSPLYTGPITLTKPSLLRVKGEGTDVVAQFLAPPAPVASPAGGIFIGQQAVSLSTRLPGEIRYTVDGSEPNASSPLVRDSILLNASTMLKSRVFFSTGGASLVSTLRFERVTPDAAVTAGAALTTDTPGPGGSGLPGLQYAYYEGKWDSMPAFDQLTAKKRGHVLLPSLDSISTRANEYGLQFKGWITIPATGVYTFYTISDDGSQLYIGDTQVVNNDGCHGDLERSGDRALMAGKHPFVLDYFQNSSGQTLQVFIKGPGIEKQQMPAAMLSGR